ncbi:MAG: hypothetical protein ACFFCI_20095 [Promethearchaeota archaeon]
MKKIQIQLYLIVSSVVIISAIYVQMFVLIAQVIYMITAMMTIKKVVIR